MERERQGSIRGWSRVRWKKGNKTTGQRAQDTHGQEQEQEQEEVVEERTNTRVQDTLLLLLYLSNSASSPQSSAHPPGP